MKTPPPIDPRDVQLAERDARIAELEAENAEREARIAELEAENAELRARLEKLERFLGLNSSNSSMSPSSDSEDERKKRKKKKKKDQDKRKPGGQPGHPGAKRELLPEDQVDAFVEHYPEQCACGLKLVEQDATGTPLRLQQFELAPKLVLCTERRLHACRCPGCGHTTRAELTEPERLGWGPRLTALIATMSVTLHATRGKLDWFITHVLGAPSSKGSVQKYLEEVSDALAPAHAQARAHVMEAEHVGCDETGWRLGRLPYWIWLAQCSTAAFVLIRQGRTKLVAQEVLEASSAATIMTDRYGSYNWLEPERNQLCRAHLMRDWIQMSQRDGPIGRHGRALVKLEKTLHAQWNQWRDGTLSREEFVEAGESIRQHMEEIWRQASECRGAPGVVNWLRQEKNMERAWVFLRHEGVELTNNQSERDVRTCVIQRKLSFGSKSEAGLRLMERLWTVGLTCKRQTRSILEFITSSVVAHREGQLPPLLLS